MQTGPELIDAFLSPFSESYNKNTPDPLYADGSKVLKDMWFTPGEGVLPEPLAQKHIDKVRGYGEKKKEMLRKRVREDDNTVDVDGVLA
ncbi:hypothetical protein EJ02DRAFT_439538 [Clathrospora elynae]|uniref:Uncharacterized protein n=1 Tax=Clathrospora elynae TaxID=706981 RepID=A0A6A5S973_9PLEO|nr:hypothetical protein EJ02DRAFT_439538 [Clathrospora elynae]